MSCRATAGPPLRLVSHCHCTHHPATTPRHHPHALPTAPPGSAGALQHLATLLPPGAPATLCLSRGVAEWLAGAQAAPGALAAWRAALPALAQGTGLALVLGPLLATPEANLQRQAALAAQLGCPVACLGHSPSSCSII